ncbi:MAG: hypothetical protein PHF37_00500 [Phycisphaerae bacterium]|nr:hypothetical protein [Phycisphaerae bacterium]
MSLSVTYNELQKAIGRYLGYGRNVYGPDDGSEKWADIEDCVKSGLRQFYSPPPVQGQSGSHQWSFLRPVTTLSLTGNTCDYDLPDDFGGIIGCLTYPASIASRPVVTVSEQAIRTLRQNSSQTGKPTHAAVRPKASDGTANQKFEILFWPTPDLETLLTYKYYVAPQALTTENPYPYGGQAHAETILESCLSIAEQRLNDEKGIHWEKFLERLASSIQSDRKTSGADFLGYNGDSSDGAGKSKNSRLDYVTVNGQEID